MKKTKTISKSSRQYGVDDIPFLLPRYVAVVLTKMVGKDARADKILTFFKRNEFRNQRATEVCYYVRKYSPRVILRDGISGELSESRARRLVALLPPDLHDAAHLVASAGNGSAQALRAIRMIRRRAATNPIHAKQFALLKSGARLVDAMRNANSAPRQLRG